MIEPKYPNITVQLVGQDGNAMSIISRVKKALAIAGVNKAEQNEYLREAMSGDYDHLLQTTMKWVDCGGEDEDDYDEEDEHTEDCECNDCYYEEKEYNSVMKEIDRLRYQ